MLAACMSVKVPNEDTPADAVIVTESLAWFVVRIIPVPATSESVSVTLSASTLFCPRTDTTLNAFWLVSPPPPPPPVELIVIASPAGFVTRVTLDPATNVSVSEFVSATISSCPATLIAVSYTHLTLPTICSV